MYRFTKESWSSKNKASFLSQKGFPDQTTISILVTTHHDPSTCPFCKWKWKEEGSKTILIVVDESGQIAPFSAEQLFGLQPDDFIVVTGKARLDDLGIQKVQLSGLFKRPHE